MFCSLGIALTNQSPHTPIRRPTNRSTHRPTDPPQAAIAYPVVALAVGPLLYRHITVLGGPRKVVMNYIENVAGIFKRMKERQDQAAAKGQEQGGDEGGGKTKAEGSAQGKSKDE